MSEPKKLIEVAMPIKEISAESVTDVRIQHGHISSLHPWWARRPLPVCRAVIFASLVPDPLDENCPEIFKDAVNLLLIEDDNFNNNYRPYNDIPFTSAIDKMEDNLRNRLLMFIGKFSDLFVTNDKNGKKTEAKNLISDFSLIKWDNKNNLAILTIARKLIWVAHNASTKSTCKELLEDYDVHYQNILKAEEKLYNQIDRDTDSQINEQLKIDLQISIDAFLNKMPKVFDPFAGGGAIPLEASRLGCRSYGNDINPVAHIIQKGSLFYPQMYGKPMRYSSEKFTHKYGQLAFNNLKNELKEFKNGEVSGIKLENRLTFDVEFYSNVLLDRVEKKVTEFYPNGTKLETPLVYYWVRVGRCSNPSCNASVPLLRQFNLCIKKDKSVSLNPRIIGNEISFDISEIANNSEGWLNRGNLKCPCCNNITDVKELKKQFIAGGIEEKLLAVISESKNGKTYRLPTPKELEILDMIPKLDRTSYSSKMQVANNRNFNTPGWGFDNFNQMFSNRQFYLLNTLFETLEEIKKEIKANEKDESYANAVIVYLAILINRGTTRLTTFGVWNPQFEKIQPIFSRQALPMVFDFPEPVFYAKNGVIGSQLDWIIKVIESESSSPFKSDVYNASSGEVHQFSPKYLTAVITDPPYYDAIAYADLSDFFYLWFQKSLGNIFPEIFATPQTPKTEECTALKHHHNSTESANNHFEQKLLQIFDAIEIQTSDIVSIMFAHQSTEAWTTLCNSILGARMNITGSWAMDTEMTGALKTDKAFLSSSVTVCAKPSQRIGVANYKEVRNAIELKVAKEVDELYKLGFRGADLLTACFGQAVSEFGKYERVEKADGSNVSVAELLELSRESAFNALLKGFTGDDFTKFYIGWLQLNGLMNNDYDDAAKFTKVGLSINIHDLFSNHILIKDGNQQHLGVLNERIKLNSKLGEGKNTAMIDVAHKLMALYGSTNRNNLLKYIESNSFESESPVWRVLTSLAELLPKDIEDHKLAVGLLTNKDQLIREAKSSNSPKPEQSKLILE